MELLSGGCTPKDAPLYREYREKLEKGAVSAGDLREGFAFFAQVCNDTESIRYEMRNLALNFQFNLDDEVYAITFAGGACASYRGKCEKPTVIFTISKETVVNILKGNIYSLVAQMAGYIKYTGPKPQAQVFQRIFELFLDRFLKRDLGDLKKAAAKIQRPAGVVKFGVIGGGQAFHFHSNGDRGSDIIAYTAIYDRNYENAKKMALT
ncbi:MAG: SCP2 sterol-binding domain-containing protein, partial [Treponema sp.]|nr:SCP2 sterol-binding domain-containing protein [Treponema sp.]